MIFQINCRYQIYQKSLQIEDSSLIKHSIRSFLSNLNINRYITFNNIIYPIDILFNLNQDVIIFQDEKYNILWSNHKGCYQRSRQPPNDCLSCPNVVCHTIRQPICSISNQKIFFVTPFYEYFIILIKKLPK